MLFTTLFTATLASLAAASPRKAATPDDSCSRKSTDTGSGAYEALKGFCSQDNINMRSSYATKGVVAGGIFGTAHAYISMKNCPAQLGLLSTADCTAAFLDACSKGDKMGYGTSRWNAGDAKGCLYFNVEAK